ncbi:MAG: hypothetical protein MJ123_05880 [Lachnospiraceae bacterium]|nr:hypothetical protein [Lachnospiraceae bacterium]
MKKTTFLVLLIITIFLWDCDSYASEKSVIEPCLQLIDINYCNLSISDMNAQISGYVSGNSEVTNITAKISLQVKKGLSWTTIKEWSSNSNSDSLAYQFEWKVEKGKTYRAVANITARTKSKSESRTIKSTEEKAR